MKFLTQEGPTMCENIPQPAPLETFAASSHELACELTDQCKRLVSTKRCPQFREATQAERYIFLFCTRCGEEVRVHADKWSMDMTHSFLECFAHMAAQAKRVPDLQAEIDSLREDMPEPKNRFCC